MRMNKISEAGISIILVTVYQKHSSKIANIGEITYIRSLHNKSNNIVEE